MCCFDMMPLIIGIQQISMSLGIFFLTFVKDYLLRGLLGCGEKRVNKLFVNHLNSMGI